MPSRVISLATRTTASEGSVDLNRPLGFLSPRIYMPLVWIPGILAMALFAIQFGKAAYAASFSASLIVALAAFFAGGLGGLIFGIPKARERPAPDEQANPPAAEDSAGVPLFVGNSNLEQVSDWLTKILIGAGLSQLANLPGLIRRVGDFLAPGVGVATASAGTSPFAAALLGYFGIAGFIGGYIWARVDLPSVLEQAERQRVAAFQRRFQATPRPAEEETDSPPPRTAPEPKADPEELDRVLDGARALERRGRVPLSAADYRRLGSNFKVLGHSLRNLGQEGDARNRYSEAVEAYKRAFELDPTDPTPLNLAGVTLARDLERYDEAAEVYQRALAIRPDYTAVVYNLACLEARRGRNREALNLLNAAIAADPKYKEKARKKPLVVFAELADDPEFKRLVGPDPSRKRKPARGRAARRG